MDTDEVLERFRREGRILSRLEHPGIGRMYDADVMEDGRPYLVLEFIEGEPIWRWPLEGGAHLFFTIGPPEKWTRS